MKTIGRQVLGLGLLAAVAACDSADGPAPRKQERTVIAAQWSRVWTAGGTEADTTLLQPWRIAVGRDLVFIADKAGARVAAFRIADGSVAWIRGGKGSGPGEFQLPTALGVDARGVLWVADARNNRMTLYRPDGSLEASVNLANFPYPEAMCPMSDGSMLVATSAATEPLYRVAASGQVLEKTELPWDDLDDAPPLAVQKLLAPTARGCVLALALGRGFAMLTERGASTHMYLDDPPLPQVEETVENGGATVSRRVVDMQTAATSVAAGGGEIAISPGGAGALEKRLVDFYRESDGAYLRSFSTPVPFERMARAGDVFFFLTHRQGYPALIAVRPQVPAQTTSPASE